MPKLEVFFHLSETLPLSHQTQRYFRRSRFSQYFILPTALHWSVPSVYANILIYYQYVPNRRFQQTLPNLGLILELMTS